MKSFTNHNEAIEFRIETLRAAVNDLNSRLTDAQRTVAAYFEQPNAKDATAAIAARSEIFTLESFLTRMEDNMDRREQVTRDAYCAENAKDIASLCTALVAERSKPRESWRKRWSNEAAKHSETLLIGEPGTFDPYLTSVARDQAEGKINFADGQLRAAEQAIRTFTTDSTFTNYQTAKAYSESVSFTA